MILEIFLASSLIVPGLGVLRFLGIRTNSFFEQLILSYILSLTIMFVLLYIGGILMTFALTSIIFLVIVVLSYGYLIILYRTKLISLSFWRSLIPDTKSEKFLMFISLVSLVVIYSTILLTRPLLDSDVVQYYLPFSREIIASNGFTYATGYDYNIFLKPVGVSVLYAWTYIVSGSFMVETFRLLPIIPVILLALMTFEISREVSGTETIGVLSTIIFILLPLHDRFLYYNAFYPDVFYYPLVFFAIFGVIKYSKTSEKRYLFWTGLAFGIGGLIKAQTILFVIACLLCLVAIEIKSKKMVFLICLVTPLFILIPNLLAEIGHPNSIIASMGPERVALLLFASILCVVVYTILEPRYTARDSLKLSSDELEDTDDIIPLEEDENDGNFLSDLKSLVTRALIVLVPFLLLASLWYVNNLLRFGSLLYTSNIEIPNLDWASDILNSISQSENQLPYVFYFPYFFFLFIDPAIMGFIWLVPLVFGFFYILFKEKNQDYTYLLFFSIVSVILIFSQTVYYASPTVPFATNPRELIPLAPMLSFVAAYGIFRLIKDRAPEKELNPEQITTFTLLLTVYFGLSSYFHSVYLYFGGTVFNSIWIYRLIIGFLSIFGLTLQQTSFQMWTIDRIRFITSYPLQIIALSFTIGFPIFVFILMKFSLPTIEKLMGRIRNENQDWSIPALPSIRMPQFIPNNKNLIRTTGLVLILISVIILPRAVVLMTQGGPQNSNDYQMSLYYGPLHELLIDNSIDITGDILTYASPPGIQYYLPNVNIIDIRYSVNLAYLRESFNSTSPFDVASNLRNSGIRHLLFNPNTISELSAALNNSLAAIMENNTLSVVSRDFGSWILYDLGPFEVSHEIIPLSGWELDTRYATGDVSFDNNGTAVNLELNAGTNGDRIAIMNYQVAHLNLSDYTFISFDVEGTNNSQLLFRFYLENDTSIDISYWESPSKIEDFNLAPYIDNSLRGDWYISVISNDGFPASFSLLEISFTKLIPISAKYVVSNLDWLIDDRNSEGNFTFTADASMLRLDLKQGLSSDKLTIISNSFPNINLTDVDYLKIDLLGTLNARILIRAYLSDGSPLDLASWVSSNYFSAMIPIPTLGISFRGDIYIGLVSNDGTPSSVSITEISLIKSG